MAISGRVPLLLVVGLLPTIFWPVPMVVIGWVALVAAVCWLDYALAVPPNRLRIVRDLPSSVRLTEAATSRLTLTNPTRRRARIFVRDAWPPSAAPVASRPRLVLLPGESLRQATLLTPRRRGDLAAAAVTIRSFGPLGLAARQRSAAVPGVLRVLPEFRSRAHLPYRLAKLRELDGQASVHVRGQGTEFDSLREYAIGDDVRSVDWRASARAQKTMVRTWRPERDRHVLIVLDTSRWAAGRIGLLPTAAQASQLAPGASPALGQLRLDAGIETCLLMGALGSASGDRMSLLAVDRQVRLRLGGATRQGSVMPSFANGLSLTEPVLAEADWSLIASQIDQLCSQRSLVILVTGLDPALYAEGLGVVLPTLAHQHQIVIAHVTDPTTTGTLSESPSVADVYDAAATRRSMLTTSALAARVSRLGVEIVFADPDRLAPAVCDAYLALKASGRL
ncbi:MAG: DUF58 domain-containing protein [Propionibacteriaceae bacterium]|jgi:uncharacterized protein (DUF58 family)|nr:DUF58 domain-containing protein [Propionibacteriaceae bacterium]